MFAKKICFLIIKWVERGYSKLNSRDAEMVGTLNVCTTSDNTQYNVQMLGENSYGSPVLIHHYCITGSAGL